MTPYPLLLKVGKDLPHRVVDFRKYATLFVAWHWFSLMGTFLPFEITTYAI